eukprot:3234854-Ditylum_brightwellii.AAC.1
MHYDFFSSCMLVFTLHRSRGRFCQEGNKKKTRKMPNKEKTSNQGGRRCMGGTSSFMVPRTGLWSP